MQLNRFTDYGLRVLIYLSSRPSEERTSLEFLSDHFSINKHHLHKISQRLSQLGWIISARGKKGGVSLNDNARTLSLATIVAELEPDMEPIDCKGIECPIEGSCRLQAVLNHASDAFMEVLGKYQLDDLKISDLAMIRLLSGPTESTTYS